MGITGDSEKLYGGEEKFCHRSPYPLNHCDQGCNVVFHGFFNNTMKGLKKFRKRIGLGKLISFYFFFSFLFV